MRLKVDYQQVGYNSGWSLAAKMDILQSIYHLQDLISKYVQKMFGEGE
jgi:hypothetical protein